MSPKETDLFHDAEFPIEIIPERVSFIDTMEVARRALHEAIEIKCFYEGTSTLLIGTETVTATAGDVIVINPYEFHTTVDLGAEKGKYHLIMVSLDFFAELPDLPDLRKLLLGSGYAFSTLWRSHSRLQHIIQTAVTETVERQSGYRLAVRGLMMELLSVLLREGLQKKDASPHEHAVRYYGVVEPALRHIRDAYTEQISIEELAALCNVSKYHFCRIFKSVAGSTAIQYLNEYRLQIAHILLLNTKESIAQIAQKCGFESENYFCRYYKRQFGISPGKARNIQ